MSRVFQGLTSQRFAGKPLRQPNYAMRDVPRCDKALEGSTIGEVTDRDHLNDAMAEMVLLCNEVMRRKSQNVSSKRDKVKKASKPLSLEYIADRCDVDDPIWGFIVRSKAQVQAVPRDRNSNIKQRDLHRDRLQNGMMQGFITVTTFTNWQQSFRWDSMHDSAFSYDETEMSEAMASKIRKYDEDGSLAAKIQNTIRCGDPWNEGVVWPRVAEISLLGALGCGRALLSLVIERLEAMPASGKHNYDYVVLQATDNSIPFYESMGFVRVGAITENDDNKQEQNTEIGSGVKEQKAKIVTGPVIKTQTTSRESLRKLCKRLKLDIWDVIFLNKEIFPGISHKSVIQKNTELFIPDMSKLNGSSNADVNDQGGENSITQWYDAKDNESPREIAKKFNVCLKQLLIANKSRIQGLQANSKLVEDTRIQVSNLDVHCDAHVPYCHWTFPDDKFENNEPSYMMARKLNRKCRQAAKFKPVEDSLAVKVTKYEPPAFVQPANTTPDVKATITPTKKPKKSKKRKLHPDQPIPPKKPKTSYFFFLDAERQRMKENNTVPLRTSEFIKLASVQWKILTNDEKTIYNMKREEALVEFEAKKQNYNIEMEKFKANHPDWDLNATIDIPVKPEKVTKFTNFVNKVVRLNEEGQREAGTEFQYYYVLTYIPDLFWCHLVPMRKKGIFGTKWPKVKGRTKWVLVGEDEGKEIDISANACEIIRSRCMKRCNDADNEEWDINDPEFERASSTITESSTESGTASCSASVISASSSKEHATPSCEESDGDVDPVSSKGLIQADTMYSRLLKQSRR